MKRRRKKTQIDGAFSWRLIEMLESPVLQVLTQSEHRMLMRLEIELAQHAGTQNGRLSVTFQAFKNFGVDRQAIAASLRTLVALGIIEKTRQGAGGRTEYHDASHYRLTFRHTDTENPSNEWRSVKTLDEAKQIAVAARKAKDRETVNRSLRSVKKDSSRVGKPQIPGGKNHPGKAKIPGGKNHPSSPGGKNHPSIYISGTDTEQPAREARPSGCAVASEPAVIETEPRLDLLHAKIAAKLGWPVVTGASESDLAYLERLEKSGTLDAAAIETVRQLHRRGAA